MALVLVMVACTPGPGQEIPAGSAEQTAAEAYPATSQALAPVVVSATATPGPVGGQIVEVTPMSEAELTAQPPAQTAGGLPSDGYDPDEPDVQDGETLAPADDWVVYSDSHFGFSVAHPADFVVRQADEARLVGLVPSPSASIYIVQPAMAESALEGVDAPDLEVRVFETGPVNSLSDWLVSAGLGSNQTQTAIQLGELPAVSVCGSTMIVPNCTTFVNGGDRVYGLRALNLEGEAMAESFSLVP